MRRAIRTAAAVALLALPGVAPPGAAADQPVTVQFAAFAPAQVDALPGETITWTNGSPRVHTVTSDTALFDAGELLPGAVFAQRFDAAGVYAYHCTIHPEMTGEIDVRHLILGALPTAAVPLGRRITVSGRADDHTQPVQIERSTGGGAFATVASASPAPDGSWSTIVMAQATADYRAVSGSEVSQTRHLLVANRRVLLRATKRGVVVTVTPSAPYARIQLQLDLHERFGWWPVARSRLDYLSQAGFRVRRPARVRAVLVARDGWTPFATSRVVVLGKARPTHMGGRMPEHASAAGAVTPRS